MPPARPAPAVARRRARTPPPKPRRVITRSPKLRVRWERVGRFGLLFVLMVVIGLYVEHTLSYLATRTQADKQQAVVNRLAHQNAILAREQQSLSDPATIVRDARALGMVRPGERAFAITGLSSH